MGGCTGFLTGCTCEACCWVAEQYQERVRRQLHSDDTDWSWVDDPKELARLRREADRAEYAADLASASGYIKTSGHVYGCQCSDCLTVRAERREEAEVTAEKMRRNVTDIEERLFLKSVDEVIVGFETLLAESPCAKFYEWCRENGRE